jgi:hypothetical protein
VLEGDSAVTPGTPISLGSMDVPNGKHREVRVVAEVVK